MAAVEICCDLNTMGVIPSEVLNKHYLFQWFKILDLGTICSGSKSLNNHHPHVAHTMLGMAMGYAAAKTVRGNTRKRSLKEKLDLLSDMEREFVYRQVQEKMQSENKQNRFWGFLFIILIIVLCLVCC